MGHWPDVDITFFTLHVYVHAIQKVNCNHFISGDVTFTDVFRDFSNMASRDPDRLKRNFDSKDPDRQTELWQQRACMPISSAHKLLTDDWRIKTFWPAQNSRWLITSNVLCIWSDGLRIKTIIIPSHTLFFNELFEVFITFSSFF